MDHRENLVKEFRTCAFDLLTRVEGITNDCTLIHRIVDLKRELLSLADFLEGEEIKKPRSG